MLRLYIFLLVTLVVHSSVFASAVSPFKTLEMQSGGRLGVAALDTATNQKIEYRANERFPFCSTFKVVGVAAILKESTKQPALLKQKMHYSKKDIVSWSPITEQHLKDGMTVSALCEATIMTSDNTAMNLLMRILGGPQAVTGYARSIGDTKFNLVRWETDLSSAIPGDIRDTTTPESMRASLQKLLFGDKLATSQKHMLKTWLRNNKTGQARIRAALPSTWVVEDKTGTGGYGATNDIGIIYPPHCKPIVVVIYYTQKTADAAPNERMIATVTKLLLGKLSKRDHCLEQALNSYD